MELKGDVSVAQGYSSYSQQARLISEDWIARNGYCLKCESNVLDPTRANTRTRDFRCARCHHAYELKSKRGAFTNQVLDGAYPAMMQTIKEGSTPTFLLLEYTRSWSIVGLKAIHHSLITETAIKPRKPLSTNAQRAGWIGCNIMLPAIAIEGQIALVRDGVLQPKKAPREAFARLENLSLLSSYQRSWAGTVLKLLHRLPAKPFVLEDVYGFASELETIYPRNQHVKPKIRQQLQVLRDAGLIRFLGKGKYEFLGKHPGATSS